MVILMGGGDGGCGESTGSKGLVIVTRLKKGPIGTDEWGKAPFKKIPDPNAQRWSFQNKDGLWNMDARIENYGRIRNTQNFPLSETRQATLARTTVADVKKLHAAGFSFSLRGKNFPIAWAYMEDENETMEGVAAPVTDTLTRSFGKLAGYFGIDERINVELEKNFSMMPKGAELRSISIEKLELVTCSGSIVTLLRPEDAGMTSIVIKNEELNFREMLRRNPDMVEESRKEAQRPHRGGSEESY